MTKKPTTRIMVFGTFDVLHKGHEHFFKQARRLAKNPFLIVSVARDANVKRIKGAKTLLGEKQRLSAVKKNPLVDKAVLGGVRDHIPHILREKPDSIALGYDQKVYTKGLRAQLKALGLLVTIKRLRAYKPHVFKSSIIKKKI